MERMRETIRGDSLMGEFSYSAGIIAKMLEELQIKYSDGAWGDSIVSVRMIANIKGKRLSINTHPDVAEENFCEAAELPVQTGDEMKRFRTPEEFKLFLIDYSK
jgi:hypothetical protein